MKVKKIEHIVREELEKPFFNKNLLFILLSPILICVSFLIFLINYLKRYLIYRKLYAPKHKITTICVGNLTLGGSGKSPLVREIARQFIYNNYFVCLFIRGYKHEESSNNILFTSKIDAKEKQRMSDETREHFERLTQLKNAQSFCIVQGKDRNKSLEVLKRYAKKENLSPSQMIIIMDDGLQHYSFSRHFDCVVLNSKSLTKAPFFSVPIGPYREGFSQAFFTKFLRHVHFRLWSRTKTLKEEKVKISRTLKKLKLSLNVKQDIIVSYKNSLTQALTQNSNHPLKSLLTSSKCFFVTGTALPKLILEDLKPLLNPKTEILKIYYSDHGGISKRDLNVIKEKNYPFITTYKDFWRWGEIEEFQDLIRNNKVFIIGLKITLYDIYLSAFNFLKALEFKSNKYRKNVACLIKYKDSFIGFKNPRFRERQCLQGGIEPFDKNPQYALIREIKEEIGLTPEQYHIRYQSPIWRYYDFPKAIRRRVTRSFYGQVQIWFLIEIKKISALEKMKADEFEGYETLAIQDLISQYIPWKRIPLETFVEELYDERILTH